MVLLGKLSGRVGRRRKSFYKARSINACFGLFFAAIESGEEDWLQVAASLKTGVDTATSIELSFAVARALPKNPLPVIRLIENGFKVEGICTIPFVEVEPPIELNFLLEVWTALKDAKCLDYNLACQQCLNKVTGLIKFYK